MALKKPRITRGERLHTTPLDINFIEGFYSSKVEGLIINLISLMGIWLIMKIGGDHIPQLPRWIANGLPWLSVFFMIVGFYNKVYVSVDTQQAKKLMDSLTGKMVVAFSGWHIIPWYYKDQKEVIEFQKHVQISHHKDSKTAILFQTSDGYQVALNLICIFNRKPGKEDLCISLCYTSADLLAKVDAEIQVAVTTLGGANTYAEILENQVEFAAEVAAIFGGQATDSDLELDLGITVQDPKLGTFDLTPDSAKIWSQKASIGVVTTALKHSLGNKFGDLKAGEIAQALQLATGQVKKMVNEHVYKIDGDLPKNISTLVLGGADAAVGGKGSK